MSWSPEKDVDGNVILRIQVKEEFNGPTQVATGGHYQAKSYEIIIDQAITLWKSVDLVWPFPISIMSTEWINESIFKGDVVEVSVAPDTVTGTITADVAIGATEIDVSQTVIDNVDKGYLIKLYDGVNQDVVGRVISIDKAGLKLTMETPTTNAFLAATPTYIQQTIQFIPGIRLQSIGRVELAKDVVGGSYLPANTTLRVRYQNNEGTIVDKVFSFIVEYKY